VPSQLVHFAKRHEGAYVLMAGGLVWVLVGIAGLVRRTRRRPRRSPATHRRLDDPAYPALTETFNPQMFWLEKRELAL
jgi:uncharacterized iron-regulated membrane protein